MDSIKKFEDSIKVKEYKITVSSRFEITPEDIRSAMMVSFSKCAFSVEEVDNAKP